MTTLMMALRANLMRPYVFLEAGPTCLQQGTGSRLERMPQKGVTELRKHHKVAAARSQPWRGGPIEAVDGSGSQTRYLVLVGGLC